MVRELALENQKLEGVIDLVDFNATAAGQRILSDEKLKELLQVLSKQKLGLKDVEPDILGRAYEYLLRKFAEGSRESAGEFYTPREVSILIAKIIEPKPGNEIYDFNCGSGGLLSKANLLFKKTYHNHKKVEPIKCYGQEINHSTYAIAKMNAFIHDIEADIKLGDTMYSPAFKNPDGSLKKFDKVLANPMWNQEFPQSVYENDPYNRFTFGYPPSSSADWGWIQHMFASLKEDGKMAVVLDTGSVSRGSSNKGSNKERDIRKAFVENDFVEAVILLPENLFYNTTSAGIILVINKNKPKIEKRKSKLLFINTSTLFEKGRPKNYLPEENIKKIANLYLNFKEEEGISRIITKEEVIKNDYNLNPSRYVSSNNKDTTLSLDKATILLQEAMEEEKQAERNLIKILKELNLEL